MYEKVRPEIFFLKNPTQCECNVNMADFLLFRHVWEFSIILKGISNFSE
jgi:hypothetical protein